MWSSSPSAECEALATRNQGMPTPNSDPNTLAVADFMAGCVNSASIAQGDQTRQVYVNSFSMFAQDAWQVTRKLNFNYGLRYEYFGPPHNSDKDLTVFNPNAPNGLAIAGTTIGNIYQQYWKGFSPRLGFAYQPKGKRERWWFGVESVSISTTHTSSHSSISGSRPTEVRLACRTILRVTAGRLSF